MFFLASGVAADNYKPRRRSRGWIWFFAILGVLTATAITIEVWYNAQQQLTPERLAEGLIPQRQRRTGQPPAS